MERVKESKFDLGLQLKVNKKGNLCISIAWKSEKKTAHFMLLP
jgi:hypothetical protein